MDIDKSWDRLLQELSPEQREQVRAHAEYLLAGPPRPTEAGPDGPGPDAQVTLREVTSETVRDICRLTDTLTPPKKHMVAPNAVSIAQAHFEPHAWFRAVYADGAPVGFLMLYDSPEEKDYFLWRFMIAEPHHGKGFGRRAIELLADYVRSRPGAAVLETSCGQGAGSPEGFYQAVGFRRNGKMLGSEVGMTLEL
jgi:diamine N-acetyltransferase